MKWPVCMLYWQRTWEVKPCYLQTAWLWVNWWAEGSRLSEFTADFQNYATCDKNGRSAPGEEVRERRAEREAGFKRFLLKVGFLSKPGLLRERAGPGGSKWRRCPYQPKPAHLSAPWTVSYWVVQGGAGVGPLIGTGLSGGAGSQHPWPRGCHPH